MDELLSKVKANLILEHTADDALLKSYITAAVSYAESYQHIPEGFYKENPMPATTEQAVIMLSSHFYESRDLTGATIDKNKVLISASEDGGDPVAVGFRAKKSNGKYKYYWLYRVKFGIPATNLATKGDSITFSTPTIEGTILRRNKADAGGKHPWKAEALEGDVTAATITNWYKEVYEPTYTTTPEKQG